MKKKKYMTRKEAIENYISLLEKHSNAYLDDIEEYCVNANRNPVLRERLEGIYENFFPVKGPIKNCPVMLAIEYIRAKRKVQEWGKEIEEDDD